LHKVGKADKELNKRLNTYNTAVPDKVFVVDKVKVDSPIAVEMCVKGFLYKYRYRNNKEYYKLNVKEILKIIHSCNDMICGNKKVMKRSSHEIKISESDEIYGLLAITKEQVDEYYNGQSGGTNYIDYKYLYHCGNINYHKLNFI